MLMAEYSMISRSDGTGLTVSLVTYDNPASDVSTLLRSLAASRVVTRIVTVDNSPTDSLRDCVESAGAEYRHLPQNIGFGAGHNRAMEQLIESSRYHLVVNPDIACEPTVLQSLYEFMDAYGEVGLTMPRVLFPDGREQHLCKFIPSPLDLVIRRAMGSRQIPAFKRLRERYELRHLAMDGPREIPYLSGCFMFLRSSALREVGLFDERFFMYMEDVDLCRRIGEKYKTVFNPHVSVTHGYCKGSYKNSKLLTYHLLSAIRYFNKWGWIADEGREKLNDRIAPVSTFKPEPAGLDTIG